MCNHQDGDDRRIDLLMQNYFQFNPFRNIWSLTSKWFVNRTTKKIPGGFVQMVERLGVILVGLFIFYYTFYIMMLYSILRNYSCNYYQ